MSWEEEDFFCPETGRRLRAKEYRALQKKRVEAEWRECCENRGMSSCPEPLSAPARGQLYQSPWARAWGRHLESLSSWSGRMTRGRSLLRQGHVYEVVVEEGGLRGYVGTDHLYEVFLQFSPLEEEKSRCVQDYLFAHAPALLDLWSGDMSERLMEQLSSPERGLFPQSEEVKLSCSCEDWADLCDHGAALLYAAGFLFEQRPEWLFALRQVSLSRWQEETLGSLQSEEELAEESFGDIFGIEISR